MKKRYVLLSCLLLAGCSSSGASANKEKVMNCKLVTNFNVMGIETNSKITYEGDKALKNKKSELVTFYKNDDVNSEEMTKFLEEYVVSLAKQKDSTKDLEGVTMEFVVKESTITITGEIDYTKIDLEKMKKADPNIKDLLNDTTISVSKLKASSEALGSVCTDIEAKR